MSTDLFLALREKRFSQKFNLGEDSNFVGCDIGFCKLIG